MFSDYICDIIEKCGDMMADGLDSRAILGVLAACAGLTSLYEFGDDTQKERCRKIAERIAMRLGINQ